MAEETKKLRWNQFAIGDDISYRGPLSYRHFKIIGWLLFVVKMVIPGLKLGTMVDPGVAQMLDVPLGIMELLAPLSIFFLLIASFSQLLVKKDYKKQMISNGVAALAIILIFNILYHRYIVSAVDAFVMNRDESMAICDAVFAYINPTGFLTFNVFLDLFLCTSVLFFLNYTPTKYFQGEKIKWFRALVVLPVLFELVCVALKLQAHSGNYNMPISFFPFLPTKPPMMFFAVCAMIVYQTVLERRFCKDGRTHEEFEAYLGTNRSRWQFAKFAAIACVVAGLIDFVAAYLAIVGDPEGGVEVISELWKQSKGGTFFDVVNKYLNAGLGGSVDLLFFAPIMLLFDYTKTYKNTAVELAIPIVSFVLVIVLYLEGGLIAIDALGNITREQVMPQLTTMLNSLEKEYYNSLGGYEAYAALLLQEQSGSTTATTTQATPTTQPATETQPAPAAQPAPATP